MEFINDEELVFQGEMLDVYDGCDAWIFSAQPAAGRTPPKKVISGQEEFSEPTNWLHRFSVIQE
ncbi:MAG: hypothetical protein Q7S40_02745 [Opitutaceae bacterium]|nr:hypothetical protein [Opitutaceae bacterium]